MTEGLAKLFMFLGEGPRGDFWNIFSNLFIYISLVLLSFRFYKRTQDEFFNFISFGFLAFILQKLVLFFAISSMHIWHIFTPDQIEPWFPTMEHYFETVAIMMMSFSFCYISLIFQGKDVKIDFSIFTPWENKDLEVRVLNYILFIGLISSFIVFIFVSTAWMEFFNKTFKETGSVTTFGQFWGDILVEYIHAAIYIMTIAYIAYRNYPLQKGENKHIITTFIIIALSFNVAGHLSHIYSMAHGEIYNSITDSVKRVFEFVGNFFFFGVVFFRLSDRMDKKRIKITQTLDEVREFTKAFTKISNEATKRKYLDFNIKLPEINSDDELKHLHSSIKNMIESIKKREDNLQANSQELQVLNEELSATYEELRNLYNDQESYIDDLKKSQNDLRAEKNKVDAILASIGDGISIQDTEYNVIYANDFYSERFGANLLGQKCYTAYENRDEICEGCPLREAFDTGEVVRAVREGYDKNNNKVFADITVSPIKNENGVIIGGIEMAKDVTSRMKLEGKLKKNIEELNTANEKLLRMDKIKTNFVSMASHELRTPLTMVKGYSELLLYERKENLDDMSYEMIKNIHTSAERLNSIISDILDVSRIDENKLHLNKQKNNLDFVIEQSVNDMRHYVNKRAHTFDVKKNPDINMFLFDANRMHQVFSNLIGNAIKYTPDGGRISIHSQIVPSARLGEVIKSEDDLKRLQKRSTDWVEIITKDNGIGIDKNEQTQIFDRFYEVGSINEHTSSKSSFLGGGAGLGLSICKGIVEAHGGIIWVYSEGYDRVKKNGSEFHVLVPYLLEEEEKDFDDGIPFLVKDDRSSDLDYDS